MNWSPAADPTRLNVTFSGVESRVLTNACVDNSMQRLDRGNTPLELDSFMIDHLKVDADSAFIISPGNLRTLAWHLFEYAGRTSKEAGSELIPELNDAARDMLKADRCDQGDIAISLAVGLGNAIAVQLHETFEPKELGKYLSA